MRSLVRAAGWVAGGLLGTAATTALLAGRAYRHHIAKLCGDAVELPDELPAVREPDREYTVRASDGVVLSVEELDPADGKAPEITVILIHGHIVDRLAWLFQRHDLAHSTAPRLRVVLYDQRSHGRSGRSSRSACIIKQLGADLHAVIRAAAPTGPVALIGHSLGGMTIMALAEDRPELFAERICGVAFLNTSAGDVGSSGLPKPVLSRRNPVMPLAGWLSRWEPSARAVEHGRYLCRNLIWSLVRTLSFGPEPVNPALVDWIQTMVIATPFEVMTDFLATFGAHNRYAALAGLRHVKALVLGSDSDRLIPYKHSEAIAALLPHAELVQVKGSGHATMLEVPQQVTKHLLDLLSRCAADLPGAENGP
jgi:pimeloyl-ACP methyl ester carboxylesterase